MPCTKTTFALYKDNICILNVLRWTMTTLVLWRGCVVFLFLNLMITLTYVLMDNFCPCFKNSNIVFKLILDNQILSNLFLKLIRQSIIITSIIDWNLANYNNYIYFWNYTLTKQNLSIILESMNNISIVRTRLDAK